MKQGDGLVHLTGNSYTAGWGYTLRGGFSDNFP